MIEYIEANSISDIVMFISAHIPIYYYIETLL